MEPNNLEMPPEKETSFLATLYDILEVLVVSLTCITVFFTFLFRVVGVEGASMMDTLYEGDRLILCPVLTSPERGDIVVINRYADDPLIKRVIGVQGDTIEIDEDQNKVRLNGELLDESYVRYPTPAYDMSGAVTVPEGYVFVMGDHRNDSHDSRSEDIGLVSVNDIVGQAVFRIWPLQRIGVF